jgi:glycosyltransferase involved in cell wall biosynthesis
MITPDHLIIDRRILQEAQTLRQAGYQVELYAGFECSKPERYEKEGIRITRFSYGWSDPRVERILSLFQWMPGRLRSGLRRAVRRIVALTGLSSFEWFAFQQIMQCQYDVLHCHDFPLLAAAVEAKRRRQAPLVYDAHELYHAQVQLPALVRRRYKRREATLIRHADLTITVNPFIARVLADDYGCALPEVLLNAAPLAYRADTRPGLREHLGLGERDRIVLYQGWMSPERGIDRLIRAARHFPRHVRLVLIGYGAHEQELRAISAAQGTDDGSVLFLGRVEAEDLPPLTRSADLGVIPYRPVDANNLYSSPNKLFEYVVAGVPFVCNDLPFLRSIIEKHGCGIITDLERPEVAAAAILSVLEDASRLRGLKDAAARAGDVLNWEIEGEKLVGLYRRLVPPTSARA